MHNSAEIIANLHEQFALQGHTPCCYAALWGAYAVMRQFVRHLVIQLLSF